MRLERPHPPPPAPLLQRRGLAAVLLLVLLVHGGLLMQVSAPGRGHRPAARPTPVPALRVRQVVSPVVPALATPPEGAPASAKAAPAPRAAPMAPPTATLSTAPTPASAPALSHAVASATAALEPPADAAPLDVPLYATRLPPSTRLRYTLQRGAQGGHAELQWQVDDGRYSLQLSSEGLGGSGKAPGPGSASVGRVDANGLAPERHTESRRGRELRAVNFQRETARVTFSGPRGELPLQAGAQDRLSWLLQLAGILEGNPALRAEGQTVRVFVIGARGDAETWRFTVMGRDDLALPAGPTPGALHLLREPSRPYDTRADVWLDPARLHLPVRVQLRPQPAGDGVEWQLEGVAGP